MGGRTSLQKGSFALAVPALLLGTIGLSSGAAADIALDIVNLENGTKLGSITLPAATGSSPTGVTFSLNAGIRNFTQDDITSLDWDLDPQTAGGDSLSLSASAGDSPCNSPADGPCSSFTLTLDLQEYLVAQQSCPAPPPPGQATTCTSLGTFAQVEFIGAAPAYACVGFERPLDHGPVTIRRNLALPLKAELFDQDGFALRRADLSAPPVVQVTYQSGISATPEDVSDEAMSVGRGGDTNEFVFLLGKWRYYLRVRNYSAPGTYTMTMISGDEADYRVDPTCEAQFVVNP
jgi:hypothetical protein